MTEQEIIAMLQDEIQFPANDVNGYNWIPRKYALYAYQQGIAPQIVYLYVKRDAVMACMTDAWQNVTIKEGDETYSGSDLVKNLGGMYDRLTMEIERLTQIATASAVPLIGCIQQTAPRYPGPWGPNAPAYRGDPLCVSPNPQSVSGTGTGWPK